MEESMDIVNENDEVVGRDTRKNVHKNYEIHRGVHVIVVNSQGEVALQRRSMAKDYYPGYLDISVGGQVASGESYHSAAVREMAEELGCADQNLSHLADYDAYSPRQREKRRVFVHRCEGRLIQTPLRFRRSFLHQFLALRNFCKRSRLRRDLGKHFACSSRRRRSGNPYHVTKRALSSMRPASMSRRCLPQPVSPAKVRRAST